MKRGRASEASLARAADPASVDSEDEFQGIPGGEFPEIDIGSDSGEDRESENDGSDSDDLSGYNSSDIDGSDESGDDASDASDAESDSARLLRELAAEQNSVASETDSNDSDADLDLDALIEKHTHKPEDSDGPATPLDSDLEMDYMRKARLAPSELTGEPVLQWEHEIEPGYATDSSTEETRNRVGNIPAHFYDDMPHIGYDVDGKRVMRPATRDELDKFLNSVEDDDQGWTTVHNTAEGTDVKLTDEELDIIRRITRGQNPDAHYNPYEDTVEWFSSKTMDMPLTGRPEPKARFLPSKWEHKKIMKIVRAIRAGRITPKKQARDQPQFYALWGDGDAPRAPHAMHMPAPKLALPGHEESYNPPAEYVPSGSEDEADADEPKKLRPRKYDALRHVPAYENFVQERFERCLDLYLAPRMLRRRPRLDIKDPSELLPQLPAPRDLRPFPVAEAVRYEHGARVRTLSVDPSGTWLATGADDGTVRMWEANTGRCAFSWALGEGAITAVAWCPDRERLLLAAGTAAGKVHLLTPVRLLSEPQLARVHELALAGFTVKKEAAAAAVDARWFKSERGGDVLVSVDVGTRAVKDVQWHRRGDYFCTVSDMGPLSVLVHQLSRHQTQAPFRRLKSTVEHVAFHTTRPELFVATQRHVRIYDLLQQTLVKTLNPGVKWISGLHIHPQGENVLVSSYDRRVVWHDLELSSMPYKTLKYHAKAVRSAQFSPAFPLMASASDDGTIHVLHARVYNDLTTNPLIVPLKILRGHAISPEGLGVLGLQWHPREPAVFSVGADGSARMWTV